MNTTKKFIIIAEPGSVVEDINSENSMFISEDELYNMLEHFQQCSSTSCFEETKKICVECQTEILDKRDASCQTIKSDQLRNHPVLEVSPTFVTNNVATSELSHEATVLSMNEAFLQEFLYYSTNETTDTDSLPPPVDKEIIWLSSDEEESQNESPSDIF